MVLPKAMSRVRDWFFTLVGDIEVLRPLEFFVFATSAIVAVLPPLSNPLGCALLVTAACLFGGIVVRPRGFAIDGEESRAIDEIAQPGDILLRLHDGSIDNWFIPGKMTHAGVFVGELMTEIDDA